MSDDFVLPENDRVFTSSALRHYAKHIKELADQVTPPFPAGLPHLTRARGDLISVSNRAEALANLINPIITRGVTMGLKFEGQ